MQQLDILVKRPTFSVRCASQFEEKRAINAVMRDAAFGARSFGERPQAVKRRCHADLNRRARAAALDRDRRCSRHVCLYRTRLRVDAHDRRIG